MAAMTLVAKTRTRVSEPRVYERPDEHYMGIRTQTPFNGMFTVIDKHLFRELRDWMKQMDIEPTGRPFFRYYVINMEGEMDVEVGIPVNTTLTGDGRVCPVCCRVGAMQVWFTLAQVILAAVL